MQSPAVTQLILYQKVGLYIDAVSEATIETIIGIRDIGVDDSQVLSKHCRDMSTLITLFQLGEYGLKPYKNLLTATSGLLGLSGASTEADTLLCSDSETETPAFGSQLPPSGNIVESSARLARVHCKLVSKLIQLADILLISRANILARRRAGLLAQFTTEELVGLIRALFSGTKKRVHDIGFLNSLGCA
ncbi:hypothetical protein GGI21_005450 [Coemansia aciculifera]|nr:hypothetical protein GGI21_005450 [Coemansia aciculifera]